MAGEIEYYNKMLRPKISKNMTKTIVDVQQIGRHGRVTDKRPDRYTDT